MPLNVTKPNFGSISGVTTVTPPTLGMAQTPIPQPIDMASGNTSFNQGQGSQPISYVTDDPTKQGDVAPLDEQTKTKMVALLTQAQQDYPGKEEQILNQFIADNQEKYPAQMGKIQSFLGSNDGSRIQRNNNPTAMTTAVAKSLGMQEGVDYVQGDPFQTKEGQTLYTAKLLGQDSISLTITAFDKAAQDGTPIFTTTSGKPRWSYINMTNQQWEDMTPQQKLETVKHMANVEGGPNGSAMQPSGFTPKGVLQGLIADNQPQQTQDNQPQGNQPSSELFRSGISTLARTVQSTPDVAKAVYDAAVDPSTWNLLFSNPLQFLKQGLGGTPTAGSANEKAQQTMASPLLGANTLQGESNEQAGGQALEALSYLPTPMSSLLRGGSFGAGNAMENNKDITGVATEAAESAALFEGVDMAAPYIGKALGAVIPKGIQEVASQGLEKINTVLGKVGGYLNPALDKVVPDFVSSNKNIIQQGAEKIFGKQFIQSNVDSWNEIFTGTKAAKKNLLTSLDRDKDPSGFLGSRGIMPSIDQSSGTMKWNAQPAIAKVEALAEPYNDAMTALTQAKDKLMGSGDMINLDDLASQAKAKINTTVNRGAGNIPGMEKQIDDEVATLRNTYGDTVNASQLDEIRKGQWSASTSFKRNPNPNTPFKGDVHFQLGSVARNIEGKVLPEVEPLLGTLSDHYDAINNLSKIDGNAVKNGRTFLQKMSNKMVGALIGSIGGPIGAVAGDIAGGMATDMFNNFTLNNPLKVAVLTSIPQDSAIYDAAQEALAKMQGQAPLASVKNGFLQLSAPKPGSAMFGGGEAIPMGGQGWQGQEAIDAQAQNAPRSTFRTIKPTYTQGGGKVTQIFGNPK